MKTLATGMIRMDHTHVMTMFHRYKPDADADNKRGLANSICVALEIHAQLEEELFYPEVRAAGIDAEVIAKSVPEHDEMRRLIGDLRSTEPTDPEYDRIFMELMRDVIHHVADEETTVLPDAERLLADRLGEIGKEMAKRRMELMKERGGEMAGSMVQAASPATKLLAGGALLAGTFMIGRAFARNAASQRYM